MALFLSAQLQGSLTLNSCSRMPSSSIGGNQTSVSVSLGTSRMLEVLPNWKTDWTVPPLPLPLPYPHHRSQQFSWVYVSRGRTNHRGMPPAPRSWALLATSQGPAPKALTFHEDVLRQREAVVLTELVALQVDQKVVPAGYVDELPHLPVQGGRETVLIKVLIPTAHQAAPLQVLDGGDLELQREWRLAHTSLQLLFAFLARRQMWRLISISLMKGNGKECREGPKFRL